MVLAGRYLLNPFFRLLAETGAREVMTAAALLIVLGTALLMQLVGMSMALGAFLAGVLLAESNYRHELEADIEPFRGLLLALFFMGIGMGIDMKVVWANMWLVVAAALVITLLKALVVWALFRVTCAGRGDALRAGSVLTGAGEFAFVLLPLGVPLGAAQRRAGQPAVRHRGGDDAARPAVRQPDRVRAAPLRGTQRRASRTISTARHGSVLMIGFGRFGQIVSQCLLAEDVDVTIIDIDAEMIQVAGRFGFKVYYGDGTRLDVLRAAGAEQGAADRDLHRQRGADQPHRRAGPRRVSRREDLRALVRPRPYAGTARQASTTSCARPSNPRCASAARRWWRSASTPTAPRSWRTSSAPATATASRPAGRGHLRRHRSAAHAPDADAAQRSAARRARAQHGGGRIDRRGEGQGGGVIRRFEPWAICHTVPADEFACSLARLACALVAIAGAMHGRGRRPRCREPGLPRGRAQA